MNSGQLRTVLRQHLECRAIFVDVFAADEHPREVRLRRPCCYVVNTDVASEPGEHWVVCYFNKEPTPGEYFDSFGKPPPRVSLKRFLGKRFKSNKRVIQASFSTVCGQYVLIYILLKSRGYSMNEILDKFKYRRKEDNDRAVVRMVQREFGISLPVMDMRFIKRQILHELSTKHY